VFYWLYDIPVLSLVGLFVLIFVGLCCLGIIPLSPIIAPWFQDKADLNGVLGDYLQYFGVIYGLLLGLLAVATYQNHTDVALRRAQPNKITGVAIFYYGKLPIAS